MNPFNIILYSFFGQFSSSFLFFLCLSISKILSSPLKENKKKRKEKTLREIKLRWTQKKIDKKNKNKRKQIHSESIIL